MNSAKANPKHSKGSLFQLQRHENISNIIWTLVNNISKQIQCSWVQCTSIRDTLRNDNVLFEDNKI